jgi:hypothetical protein
MPNCTFRCTECSTESEHLVPKAPEPDERLNLHCLKCNKQTPQKRIWSNRGSIGLRGCTHPKENG